MGPAAGLQRGAVQAAERLLKAEATLAEEVEFVEGYRDEVGGAVWKPWPAAWRACSRGWLNQGTARRTAMLLGAPTFNAV